MATIVLDSSALLAVILDEPGGADVAARMEGALISAVNLSEVYSRLGPAPQEDAALAALVEHLHIVPFDAELARDTGRLRASTRALGLSLGDRACLALAIRERATVLTGDRAWSDVRLGIEINLIR